MVDWHLSSALQFAWPITVILLATMDMAELLNVCPCKHDHKMMIYHRHIIFEKEKGRITPSCIFQQLLHTQTSRYCDNTTGRTTTAHKPTRRACRRRHITCLCIHHVIITQVIGYKVCDVVIQLFSYDLHVSQTETHTNHNSDQSFRWRKSRQSLLTMCVYY